MRLLVCGMNYYPEMISTGKYTTEMTRWLAEQGHEVRMVTGYPYYPEWRLWPGWPVWRYSKSSDFGVEVIRCPIWVPHNLSGAKRILHLLSFAFSVVPALLVSATWRPDCVVCVAPTIGVAPAALALASAVRAKSLLHVQDLEVDAAVGLGMLGRCAFGQSLALRVQDSLIRRFDLVTTISPEMVARIVQKGAAKDSVSLVPNWVTDSLLNGEESGAVYRSELGVSAGETLVLYAGNLGVKQGLDVVLNAFAVLQKRGVFGIKLVLCGEGAAHHELVQLASSLELSAVQFMPLQPVSRLGELLRSCDIHVVCERSGAAGTAMPSKLGGILASGRPVVVAAEPYSALSRTVTEAAAGIVLRPEDPVALADAFTELSACPENRSEMGANGRKWARAHLNIGDILHRMEARISRAIDCSAKG